MINIGQKVTFNPFTGISGPNDVSRVNNTEGTVKYVNSKNRWFSVEWGDPKTITSFNFNDIVRGKVKLAAD